MKQSNIIFGIHPCLEALQAGKEIDKILIRKGLSGEHFPMIMDLIKQTGTPYQFVPVEKLNRITRKNHQGIIGFTAMISYQPIEEVVQLVYERGEIPMVVALDGVTDVRNMGAVARSAEVAGAHALLVPDKGSAQINAEAIKSSAGALNLIPVCRTSNLVSTLKSLQEMGLKLIGATEKAEHLLYDTPMVDPVVLIMGSEDLGISNPIIRICDELVKIPQKGQVASLNVSAAAAVMIFEALRQRNQQK
jgi:23S rRNA (guanosine2251-2'-O)-methyltransferase